VSIIQLSEQSITTTCQIWHRVGSEFLFRCLFFDEPAKLSDLCTIVERSPSLCWWTRRIHITRYHSGHSLTVDDVEDALISILRNCPNLEIFVIDWPMSSCFGPVMDTLCEYASKYLKTVHLNVPASALAKVIWAIDSLPYLLVIHIEIQAPPEPDCVVGTPRLGSANMIPITLRHLAQMSLRGYFQDFLEHATEWTLPSLQCLSLDSGNSRTDEPDIVEFLTYHGADLTFLDLYSITSLDVPTILDLCPLLTTFTFNADWRLPTVDVGDAEFSPTALVNRPHDHITRIGLHGLLYAFGVGFAAKYISTDPVRAHFIRLNNDRNFAALTKANFPKLKCVRTLSRVLLRDLEQEDGPNAEDGCLDRWERWWAQCARTGVRLEDCTGAELGTLPQNGEDSDGEDEEEEEKMVELEGEEDEEGDSEDEDSESEDGGPALGTMAELRQLLEECKKMSEDREEPNFGPWAWASTSV
jgi:hypothetical protein